MSEILLGKDSNLIDLGITLGDLKTEMDDGDYDTFFSQFQRLYGQKLSAQNIVQELLVFIQYDQRHGAYKKLKALQESFEKQECSRQPVDPAIDTTQGVVSAEVQTVVDQDARTTLPDIDREYSRRSAPTLTNEVNGSDPFIDDDLSDRETLIPE